MRVAALLCVVGVAFACPEGGRGLPTPGRPSTVPSLVPPPPPPQASRVISVGEEIKDALTFHGNQRVFELTAPSDGTLVARVSWERSRGVLELMLANRRFAPSASEGSIVGMLLVAAGERCRVQVADGAPWDYDDLFVTFVLTTSIE